MVHLSGKNIFSPIMSKNLSGVPLKHLKNKGKNNEARTTSNKKLSNKTK
jgi:hypothetical protein